MFKYIISKKNFKKIEETMANSRNAVCGIINTKKPDDDTKFYF